MIAVSSYLTVSRGERKATDHPPDKLGDPDKVSIEFTALYKFRQLSQEAQEKLLSMLCLDLGFNQAQV